MRQLISTVIFKLVSLYTRHFPIDKGKSRIVNLLWHRGMQGYSCLTKSIDGRVFEFNSLTKHNRWVFFYGESDPYETALIRCHVKDGETAIDAGANVGWFTTLLSQLTGEQGRVFAIEPVPGNFEVLCKSVELNSCQSNVTCYNRLCGDRDGYDEVFEFPELDPGLSSQRPISDQCRIAHKIELIRLDDLINDNGLSAVDFLKVDVEGAELALLRGCAESLRSGVIKSILIEANDERSAAFGYAFQDCIDLILDLNDFDCFRVCRDRIGIRAMRDRSDFEFGDNLVFLLKSAGKLEHISSLIVS
ncbi:MAG: FkbM family methyltransferase [Candidatus Zixiibacteriota bacterium]